MTSTPAWDPWNFREQSSFYEGGRSPVGFTVEGLDGKVGTVDEATADVGASQIVVDTGPWIFGRKVLLPAGTVDRVDWDAETVYVGLSKDDVKNSPEAAQGDFADDVYRRQVEGYFGTAYGSGRPRGGLYPGV